MQQQPGAVLLAFRPFAQCRIAGKALVHQLHRAAVGVHTQGIAVFQPFFRSYLVDAVHRNPEAAGRAHFAGKVQPSERNGGNEQRGPGNQLPYVGGLGQGGALVANPGGTEAAFQPRLGPEEQAGGDGEGQALLPDPLAAGEQQLKARVALPFYERAGKHAHHRAQAVPAHGLPHGGLQMGQKVLCTQRGAVQRPCQQYIRARKSVRRHGKAPFF
ncbi:Uncharacterised protein [uncultured Ruminococcus sp.]|nr:Uncharacterised protein [uncultured Ruminococcus sp.]